MTIIQHCPECSGINIENDQHRGENICHDCGLVIEDKMVKIEVPVISDDSGSLTRDGIGGRMTETQPDFGLSTNIGNYSDLKKLPTRDRYKFRRLNTWQNRTSLSIERNLKFALVEIKRISSKLHLTSRLEEEASRLYRQAAYKGIARGRAMEVVVAATIYMACRYNEIPITLEELVRVYDETYTKKEIGRTFRVIARRLELRFTPQHPSNYIPKICSKVKLDARVQTKAMELLEESEKLQLLSGRGPRSTAAAVIYIGALLAGQKRTQKDVAEASDITEVTLRNRYQEMIRSLKPTILKSTNPQRIIRIYKRKKVVVGYKPNTKGRGRSRTKSKRGRPKIVRSHQN